jgi:hypothetical protein
LIIKKGTEKNHCFLDPEPGSCEASKKQWYFEPKSGQCKQFIYGGCEGNQNNFKTKALCEKDCIGNKVKNFRSAPEPLTDSGIEQFIFSKK